jgi:hypothetical protein
MGKGWWRELRQYRDQRSPFQIALRMKTGHLVKTKAKLHGGEITFGSGNPTWWGKITLRTVSPVANSSGTRSPLPSRRWPTMR